MLNRVHLFQTIERVALSGQPAGALLMVRMQRLREFEAVFGYEAGKALVDAFEVRLRECLRAVDEAVQIGECDFAVVLPGLRDLNHAMLAASKVARAFMHPLEAQGRSARAIVSVGLCMASAGQCPDQLCRQADVACQEAARLPERAAAYRGQAQPQVVYDDLYQAITTNRLQVYLQPIFGMDSGTLCGYESLARWQDPVLGFVSPELFIGAAEKTGLIEELTRWSVNATLRHCAPAFRDTPTLQCGINISPIALMAEGFVDQIAAALRIWNVRPEQVVLELTETVFVDSPQLIGKRLTELRESGLRIAVDDFGTGYSSLSYFRHFHVDELKLDVSFVRDMEHNPRTCKLVESMIRMAHSLEAVTVAEGIENTVLWNRLRDMGCDLGQGYYPGKPAPAAQALAELGAG